MTTPTKHAKKKAVPELTPGGWIRGALYALGVLLGLAATLADTFGFGDYKTVLAESSALLIVLTGSTAILNLGKAEDQQINLREVIPSLQALWGAVTDLRENEPQRVADEVVKRIPAPAPAPAEEPSREPVAEDPGANLPVFRGPVTRD